MLNLVRDKKKKGFVTNKSFNLKLLFMNYVYNGCFLKLSYLKDVQADIVMGS